MRKDYEGSHKFGANPFTAWLHAVSMDGTYDMAGDVQFGQHATLIGRHVLYEDSNGFVYRSTYRGPSGAAKAEQEYDAFVSELDDEDDDLYEAPMCEHEGCGRLAALPSPYCPTHEPGGLWNELRQAEREIGTI